MYCCNFALDLLVIWIILRSPCRKPTVEPGLLRQVNNCWRFLSVNLIILRNFFHANIDLVILSIVFIDFFFFTFPKKKKKNVLVSFCQTLSLSLNCCLSVKPKHGT